MTLGVAGLLGEGAIADARRVQALGFRAASWLLPSLECAQDELRLDATRDALEAEDIALAQLLPPQFPSLVHPDPAERAAGIEALRLCLAAAVRLGAPNLYIRPGSLNGAGPWTPHPDNRAPETVDRLIESLQALAPHAEALGVPLALEGHVVSPLHSVAVVREVLDRVACPKLKFNADPVNMISNLDVAYDNTALLTELFDVLGDAIVIAHAKDVTVEDRLVLHLEETLPGQGHLDYDTFLRRFDRCCPTGVVLIEHLSAERVPEARRALLEFAARAGLAFN